MQKFEDVISVVGAVSTSRDHQKLGFYLRNFYRQLVRIEKRAHASNGGLTQDEHGNSTGVENLGEIVEYISTLRFLLDEVWAQGNDNHCPENHSPYYGSKTCAYCDKKSA